MVVALDAGKPSGTSTASTSAEQKAAATTTPTVAPELKEATSPTKDHREDFLLTSTRPALTGELDPGRLLDGTTTKTILTTPPSTSPLLSPTTEFASTLTDLHSRGFELNLTRGLSMTTEQHPLNTKIEHALLSKTGAAPGGFRIFENADPITTLNFQIGADKELAPALRQKNSVVVAPLTLETRTDSDNTATIIVRNALSPSEKPIYETKVSVGPGGTLETAEATRLQSEVYAAWKTAVPEIRAALDKITTNPLTATPDYIIAPSPTGQLSKKDLASFAALKDKGFNIQAEYYPDGGAVDRAIRSGFATKAYEFELSAEKLEAVGNKRLQVNGEVQSLALNREFEPTSIVRDPKSGSPISVDGMATFTRTTDQYGNSITRQIGFPYLDNLTTAVESISISPPLTVASPTESGFTPLHANLRALGYDLEVPALLERKSVREIGEFSDRRFITNLESAPAREKYGNLFAVLNSGISSAENLFGYAPSTQADQVFIVHSESPNAYFNRKDPSTVVIQDKLLDSPKSLDPRLVGFHEAVHLIDGAYGWRLSGGELEKLHGEIEKNNPAFFKFINESRFIPNSSFGGHAADNPKEFLASLSNTLNFATEHKDTWEEKLRDTSAENRASYLAALKALKGNIATINGDIASIRHSESEFMGDRDLKLSRSVHEIGPKTPLGIQLDDRIAWLERNQ